MFDVGFSEIVVIAIVALVVLGPERLPKAARFAGLWARKIRGQWNSVKAELESEISADELRRTFITPIEDIQRSADQARAALLEMNMKANAAVSEVQDAAKAAVEPSQEQAGEIVADSSVPAPESAPEAIGHDSAGAAASESETHPAPPASQP